LRGGIKLSPKERVKKKKKKVNQNSGNGPNHREKTFSVQEKQRGRIKNEKSVTMKRRTGGKGGGYAS